MLRQHRNLHHQQRFPGQYSLLKSPAGVSGESAAGQYDKIVDPETGALVPRGERGEIAVRGPTLMLGYVGVPPEETLDDEGYFRTGDSGHIDEKGRLYGRDD